MFDDMMVSSVLGQMAPNMGRKKADRVSPHETEERYHRGEGRRYDSTGQTPRYSGGYGLPIG
jgi:hypothetical protein